MKSLKILFLLLVLLFSVKYSYAYEKLDFFDKFHIYTPYIYILQDETTIEKVKILLLFHDNTTIQNNEQEILNFDKEAANWESFTEKDKIFIMGFDLEQDKSFEEKEDMDKIVKRILIEVDRMKNTCGTKDIEIYTAGTNFGGNIALLFNLIYDNFNGALCMNISKPSKFIEKNLKKCKNKKFYFFHCDKNKDMSASKVNSLKKKLIKKGAVAETFIYKNSKDILPEDAYFDAIDEISKK